MAKQLKLPSIYMCELKDIYNNNTLKELYTNCDILKIKKYMDDYELHTNRYYLCIRLVHFNETRD